MYSDRMTDLWVAHWLETFLTYGLLCLAVIHLGLLANACTVLARIVLDVCLAGMCIGSWEKYIDLNDSGSESKLHS